MRTANPSLNDKAFEFPHHGTPTMTLNGTVNKTIFLLIFVIASAAITWEIFAQGGSAAVKPYFYGGAIISFLIALVTIFKKDFSPITAPLYAIAEGIFLGALSAMANAKYPGIVVQAVGLTFGTLFSLLVVYKSGMIKFSENFKLGIAAATGGIFFIYLVSIIKWLLGGTPIPFIHSAGPMGIGFSVFVVVIAALNLVLDFDFIESGVKKQAPKYMEWYSAFGLLVTLVWLYVEILRLLSKLRR